METTPFFPHILREIYTKGAIKFIHFEIPPLIDCSNIAEKGRERIEVSLCMSMEQFHKFLPRLLTKAQNKVGIQIQSHS